MTSKEARIIKTFLDSKIKTHNWNEYYHLVKDTLDISPNEFHLTCGDLEKRGIIDEDDNRIFISELGLKELKSFEAEKKLKEQILAAQTNKTLKEGKPFYLVPEKILPIIISLGTLCLALYTCN